jgi:hypothetical protein
MISTRDLAQLGEIEQIKELMQSLAILDAINADKWENKYYSFNNSWGKDIKLGSMRDGSGDEYFALFSPLGAIIKGFAHESVMSPYRTDPPSIWSGVITNVPKELSNIITEPAFSPSDTTFCIWCLMHDKSWKCGQIIFPEGKDPDGSEELLSIFDRNPRTYKEWAEKYYERQISLDAITKIYNHLPLLESLIYQINPKASMREIIKEAITVGYK